jgi:hypothetical protein
MPTLVFGAGKKMIFRIFGTVCLQVGVTMTQPQCIQDDCWMSMAATYPDHDLPQSTDGKCPNCGETLVICDPQMKLELEIKELKSVLYLLERNLEDLRAAPRDPHTGQPQSIFGLLEFLMKFATL